MITIAMVARSFDNIIGVDNNIPWHCAEDLKAFKAVTLKADAVVMGRKTWESIPNGLPFRNVCVLSSKPIEGVSTFTSVKEFLTHRAKAGWDFCVVAGGASVYDAFIEAHAIDEVLETVIPLEIGNVDNAVRLSSRFRKFLDDEFTFLGASTLLTKAYGNVEINHHSKC